MSLTSDQARLEEDPGKQRPRTPSGGPTRSPWNWFGAMFGIVVLVGAALVYVGGGSDDGADDVAAVAAAPAEEPTADEGTHDEAGEAPLETQAAEHDDETAEEPLGTPAAGHDAEDAALATDVIEIEMADYSYTPASIELQAGVPVTFRFTNTGNFQHEAMIGDAHMQEEFAAAGDHDDSDGHHGGVMAVMVEPGETADLEVVVDEPGTTYMACHIKGHYEKGQVATINVTA